MFSYIWHTFFFDPIYNGLIFFIDTIPGGDVGLAIVGITIVVKLILLPLSIRAAKTQKLMREIEPRLKEIKETHKDDRETLARETMTAYKEMGIRPFASIFLLFFQIPIVIALYWSVYRGGGVPLPDINVDLLYAFVPTPETANMIFLGLIDVAGKSLPLAALAGITQFFHARLAMPAPEPRAKDAAPDLKADFARSMSLQMRYVMPVIIFIVAYTISAAIALYFTVSNLMAIGQEYIVRKHK
jgi:YidC/Oxa1 family membrane protein insertase